MLEKITIIILIICNILLWVSHFKMKIVIGALIKTIHDTNERTIETIEEIMEGLK